MAAAGSPATGVGGMYYMILFAVSIILRLYRNNLSRNSERKSRIVSFAVVTVYLIVLLSTLQAFKIINIGDTLNYLSTTFSILF
jgi:membrane-bound ClpP family serine protease